MKPSEQIRGRADRIRAEEHVQPSKPSLFAKSCLIPDVEAILEYLDEQAKLSESAAGRREPTGADVVGSLLHKWKTEREAEPGGGEGDEEGARAMYEHAVLSRGVQTWELIGNFERSQWLEAFRFARDAGKKEAEAESRTLRNAAVTAEERASKAEADHAEAKLFLAEMNRQLYDALECDGHPSWLDDIIPRAHQVMRLKREAEAELAAAKGRIEELHDAVCRPGQPADHDFFRCALSGILELKNPTEPLL